MVIDGNSDSNDYVAKDIEEAHGDEMEDHPVTDDKTLNTIP